MKLKSLLIVLLFIGAVQFSYAQYRAPRSNSGGSLSDRIYFGGGGGLNGGTNYLNVSLSPLVGYKITESFSSGLQVTYQYVKILDSSYSNYGGGPFATYVIGNKFMIYSQFEYMSIKTYNPSTGEPNRFNGRSLFAGIGWNEPLNDKVSFQALALYDLIYGTGENSAYNSPFQIRIGIVAGF
ncbi:MAG: hypothetical protein RIC35_06865 [Marinoscillum sp.]